MYMEVTQVVSISNNALLEKGLMTMKCIMEIQIYLHIFFNLFNYLFNLLFFIKTDDNYANSTGMFFLVSSL